MDKRKKAVDRLIGELQELRDEAWSPLTTRDEFDDGYCVGLKHAIDRLVNLREAMVDRPELDVGDEVELKRSFSQGGRKGIIVNVGATYRVVWYDDGNFPIASSVCPDEINVLSAEPIDFSTNQS